MVGMMTESEGIFRVAGWSTWLALVALVISAIALALFFGGPGEPFGSINDAFIAIALVALVPAIVAVDRIAGERGSPWVRIISVAAIAGIVLITIGQVLLITRNLTLEGSYVTGGIGVVPVLAWIVLVAVLSLGLGVLSPAIGWLAVAALATIVVSSIVVSISTGLLPWVASVALLVAISAWLGGLAVEIGSRAATT
jgi:hypothetical protein